MKNVIIISSVAGKFDFVLKGGNINTKFKIFVFKNLKDANEKIGVGDSIYLNFSERNTYSEELIKEAKEKGVNVIFLHDNLFEKQEIIRLYGGKDIISCMCDRRDISLAIDSFL